MIEQLNTTPSTISESGSRGMPEGLAQFSQILEERTKVPPSKACELWKWPQERLRAEVRDVHKLLNRFARAVVDAMEEPISSHDFLRDLDLKLISRDHNWRAIFSTLRTQSVWTEEHKRSVVGKYLQYLSFRKCLLDTIITQKAGLQETSNWSVSELLPAQTGRSGSKQELDGELKRLPVGEPVHLNLPVHGVELFLTSHRFRLVGGKGGGLVDSDGICYRFQLGRNLVGRHTEADIALPSELNSISRVHLVVEWNQGSEISLTDLSSGGTFILK